MTVVIGMVAQRCRVITACSGTIFEGNVTLKYEVRLVLPENDDTVKLMMHLRHGDWHRDGNPAVIWFDGVVRYMQYNKQVYKNVIKIRNSS